MLSRASRLRPFKLERFFALHEFSAPYQACNSDVEALDMKALLAMADPDSLDLWNNLSLAYTEAQGHPELLREIAGMYTGVKPEEVLTAVPEEGIYIAMNTLLREGDHVVCVCPGYQSLHEVARACGCDISFWRPVEKDGRCFFDPADLRAVLRDDTKLVVVNFPHNPTGAGETAPLLLVSYLLNQCLNLLCQSRRWKNFTRLLRLYPASMPTYSRMRCTAVLNSAEARDGLSTRSLQLSTRTHEQSFCAAFRRHYPCLA